MRRQYQYHVWVYNYVHIAFALTMSRCGPKEQGFERLKAPTTDNTVKRAVVSYWKIKGFHRDLKELPDGSFTENPGQSPALQSLMKNLDSAQRVTRYNLTQKGITRDS